MNKIDNLKRSVNNFLNLKITPSNSYSYQVTISGMHSICAEIVQCEEELVPKETIVETVKPAREIQGRSPFINRLQTWPRGYPGDYETIEYLLQATNKAPAHSIEYYCEEYALRCPAAQQHRNKILIQSDKMLRTIFNAKTQKRILSISSGNCMDVRAIKHYLEKSHHEIVLLDADEAAIEFSRESLKEISSQCIFIQGFATFSQVQEKLKELGPFDLVTAGGLFDYLKDRHITRLMRFIYNDLLADQGELFFTNFAEENPFRTWMEYMANWVLIERTEADINRILHDSAISDFNITFRKESTGLTNIIEIKKPNLLEKPTVNESRTEKEVKPARALA
jgi:extracellular factor (EF) 3-hydroxypalmitic acid methyl ester biosynthesis protein